MQDGNAIITTDINRLMLTENRPNTHDAVASVRCPACGGVGSKRDNNLCICFGCGGVGLIPIPNRQGTTTMNGYNLEIVDE